MNTFISAHLSSDDEIAVYTMDREPGKPFDSITCGDVTLFFNGDDAADEIAILDRLIPVLQDARTRAERRVRTVDLAPGEFVEMYGR